MWTWLEIYCTPPCLDNDVGNPNSEIVSQMLKEALESEKEPQANKIRSK